MFLVIIIGANVTGCLFTVTPFVMSYEARIQKLKESSTNGSIPNVLVYEAYYPFDISGFPMYQVRKILTFFNANCGVNHLSIIWCTAPLRESCEIISNIYVVFKCFVISRSLQKYFEIPWDVLKSFVISAILWFGVHQIDEYTHYNPSKQITY